MLAFLGIAVSDSLCAPGSESFFFHFGGKLLREQYTPGVLRRYNSDKLEARELFPV